METEVEYSVGFDDEGHVLALDMRVVLQVGCGFKELDMRVVLQVGFAV